jgi:hypothetical protein
VMTFVVTDLGQEHVHKRLHPSVIPLVPNGPEERG